MSTRIYNAFKINDLTVEEVIPVLKEIREEYIEKCVQFIKKAKGKDEDFATVFEEVRGDMSKMEIAPYGFNASAVLYFHGGNIYVQFFGLELSDEYEKKLNLTDYHYQNQSDPWYDYDDKLTDEEKEEAEVEYEQRRKVWEDIYEDSWIPSKCGLVFEICTVDNARELTARAFGHWGG